jgi:hypothetical protein
MRAIKLLLAGCAAIAITAHVQAQTADEVVSKYVTAIGGADNWKKVNSIRKEGSFNVQGNDVSITITVLHNKGMRQDISVAGMSGYVIVSPTSGSTFLPFQGQTEPQPTPADALKLAQDAIDAQDVLVDYKAKGHSVELAGKETIDGAECFKLIVTLNSGKKITDFFDAKTGYLVRKIAKQMVNGQEVEQATTYSNFQKLPEGIVVPMTLIQPFGEITLSKVEINKPVDESIFKG